MIYKVSNGYAIIDEEDLELVEQYSWHIDNMGYVKTNLWDKENKTWVTLRLHQLLIGHKEGYVIDHENRNRRDCRRSNLRHITRQHNWYNSDYAEYLFYQGRLTNKDLFLTVRNMV